MSGHPYPYDKRQHTQQQQQPHPQQQTHMHAQAQAFQPGMYQFQGQAPMHPMPTSQYYGGAAQPPQMYYPQQLPHQQQQQQQQHQAYAQHQPQYHHHAPPSPHHHHHHAHPYQQQQPPHVMTEQPAAPAMDAAVAEAEVRKAVEAALATPSLLRGAASGGGASGGYTFAHHKSGRGKQQQQHQQQQQQGGNMLKKLQGGALPFDVVCALPGVKRAAQGDRALVQRALEAAEGLTVAGNGKQQRVARTDMLPGGAAADLPCRCVLLTRLPQEKANEAGVKALMAGYGAVGSVVVVGGEQDQEQEEGAGDGGGVDGEEEATAAGRGPPMVEVTAVVEFVEGKGAVKCVGALSGGSDWRRGLRAEFALGGLTLPQAAKHFGVELAGAATNNGGGGAAEDGGDGGAAGTSSTGAGAGSSQAMSASAREARLPPTFREGTHTGVVMEMVPGFATAAATAAAPAAEGAAPQEEPAPAPVQVQRGVIKREGRVRHQISFELPAAEVGAGVGVGTRVDFVVKHVENKAVVVGLQPSTAPPPAPVRAAKKEAGAAGGGGGGAPSFVQAKGPDEKGGVGFLMPRTKPGEAMQELLGGLRQLKLAGGKSG